MKLKNGINNSVFTLILLFVSMLAATQVTGSFKGKIIEQSIKQPVAGAGI